MWIKDLQANKFFSLFFNALQIRLNFRQRREAGRKQGKIRHGESFSAELSTETVDAFALESARQPGQPNGVKTGNHDAGRQNPGHRPRNRPCADRAAGRRA
jgi:hypothetical protein